MTDPHHRLDSRLLFHQRPIQVFRIARKRFATLAGVGAALYPGRWNRAEQFAVYTSLEIGTTVLERMVHTSLDAIPSGLALNTIHIAGEWAVFGSSYRDRETGAELVVCPSLAEAKELFASLASPARFGGHPFAVAVPSVIVPVWNVVLYPEANGFFNHVSLQQTENFELDPRLFPAVKLDDSR